MHCHLARQFFTHSYGFTTGLFLFLIQLSLIYGLPASHVDKDGRIMDPLPAQYKTRLKRGTPVEHTAVVDQFLRELENSLVSRDIVFILDRSRHAGNREFYLHQRRFLYHFIKQYLRVMPSLTHIAVITYGRDVTTVIDSISVGSPDLLKCQLVEDSAWLDQVQYIERQENGANVRDALDTAASILQNRKHTDSLQNIVLMTSGHYEVRKNVTDHPVIAGWGSAN